MKKDTKLNIDLVSMLETFGPLYREHVGALLPKGISPARLRILAVLSEHGALSMSELRQQTGGTAQNLTGLIDALEKDGDVTRQQSERDRRVTLIELTRTRKDRVLADRDAHRGEVSQLFDILDTEEKAALASALPKLIQHLRSN